MEPGNGINKSTGVPGAGYSTKEPVSKEEPTGKFTGAGKSREVTSHPPTSQLKEHSGTPTASKSIHAWEIEISEAKHYLDGKITELDNPSAKGKKELQHEIREIHAQLITLRDTYNQRTQKLFAERRITREQALEVGIRLPKVIPHIEQIEQLMKQLGKWRSNKETIRQQVHQHLQKAHRHFLDVKTTLEWEHVLTPVTETAEPKPARSSRKSVQADLKKLATDMEQLRTPELRDAYRKTFLNGPMSRLKQPLHGFYSRELERFRKLKPLLEYSNAWYSRLHQHGAAQEPNDDAAKCFQALKLLEEQRSLLDPRNIDKELDRQELLTSLKKADELIYHLHRFDRFHSEELLRLLTETCPSAEPADHLQLLLTRHQLPPASSKFTSDGQLARKLSPLNHVLKKYSDTGPSTHLYTDFRKAAAFALKSPEAFESLSASVITAEELQALSELYDDWPRNERLGDLEPLADSYQVARLDLKLTDVDQLEESLGELPQLKAAATRQLEYAHNRRKIVCDTCCSAISDHVEAQLIERGIIDRTISNKRSREKLITELNDQLEDFATVHWDDNLQQPLVTLLHTSPYDIEQSLEQFLETESEVAVQVSGRLQEHGLAQQTENHWQLELKLSPRHHEFRHRLNANMAKFHAGLKALKTHEAQIERYVEIQREQSELAEQLKQELGELEQKLDKKILPRRKTRKKLFAMAEQTAKLPATLSKTSKVLKEQQQELFKMMAKGKIRPQEAAPVLRTLHRQLASSQCWSTLGSHLYQSKEESSVTFEQVESRLAEFRKSLKPRFIYQLISPEKVRILKEARQLIAAGATATSSPRVLMEEYAQLNEKLASLSRKDRRIQELAAEMAGYISEVEQQWPMLTPDQLKKAAAAA